MEATYHEICRIPVGDSFRKVEVVDRVPGGKVRDTRRVVLSGESGDLIVHDNVVPRRFGADRFEETFFGWSVKGFGECLVGVAFARLFGIDEGTVFVEVSIFDDVVSGVGESCIGFRSALDVTMFSVEVEVPSIFDVRFLFEEDESVVMRSVEVFLSGEFVTFRVLVEFL